MVSFTWFLEQLGEERLNKLILENLGKIEITQEKKC